MTNYTFIHPTKSGGTAVENYFKEHYSEYIQGYGHNTKCSDNNNPIIIIRDVKSRFLSIYKYWKSGSELFKRDIDWKTKCENISILDFIELLKNKDEVLYREFTWDKHFYNTHWWIGDAKTKNIIIIKYEKNLNDKIQILLNKLNIPNKNIPLSIINKSETSNKDEDEYSKLECEEVKTFIKHYYREDIELINKIETNPELFNMVI